MEPLVSIIIPVKNGIQTIKKCLDAIYKQSIVEQLEVIIIDSGSTDGTLEILKNFPLRLYHIHPCDFSHGGTRNFGVSLARGEFVAMTVQDAIPSDPNWIEKMLIHFKDPIVAGVCGQQVVPHHKDKNPHKWYRPQNKPNVRILYKDNCRENFVPKGWDDVNAVYRKDSLIKIPFQVVNFSEDKLWAADAFKAGYKLVFDTNSFVEHYHHANPKFLYSRIIIELYIEYLSFKTITSYPITIKELLLIVYRNFKYKVQLKWIFHNWMILWVKNKAFEDVTKAISRNEFNESYLARKGFDIPVGKLNKKV